MSPYEHADGGGATTLGGTFSEERTSSAVERSFDLQPGTVIDRYVVLSKIGGVHHCVAYGPGVLEQAHQPDEWCSVDEMVRSTQVMALAIADLLRG